MKVSEIIKGLSIIEKNRPENENGYHLRAEHDRIYAGSLEWKLPTEDQEALHRLGWDKDEDADGYTASV